MTNFFEDLGKKLGETAETVSSLAGDAMEVQKLRYQVRNCERSNGHDLEDLGRAVYQRFLDGVSVDETAQELCAAIQEREEVMAECAQKIAIIKGEQKCPVCGKCVAKEMSFCPYCGTRMPDFPEAEEVVEEEVEAEAEVKEETEEKIKEEASEAEASATEAVEEAVEDVADNAEDIAKRAADLAKEAAEKAAEKFNEAAEKISEKVSHFDK